LIAATRTPRTQVASIARAFTRRPALLALFTYTALSVWYFRHAWADPRHSWIGDPGDPAKFMWSLRWNSYALAHGMNPFFTHHINFPHGVNLLWDTSIPLPSMVVAPITSIFGPVLSFNVLTTAAPALSAFFAYVCFRRYVHSHVAAVTGGLLYGFSPYMIGHLQGGHLNLSLAMTPPIMLLLLDEILVQQRHRPAFVGAALGALAAAQLLIGQELLATEAITAAVGVLALALVHPRRIRQHAPYAARALGIALGVFAALAAAPVTAALFSSRRPRHGTLWGPDTFVSDVFGFVVPTGLQHFHAPWMNDITSRFTDSCCIDDSHTYLGLPLIVVFASTAVRRWSKTIVRVATLAAIAMLVLSLGPHLHVQGHVTSVRLPEAWLASVPLLGNMLVSRLMLYVYLLAGLLVAITLDGIWKVGGNHDNDELRLPGMPRPRRRWSALIPIIGVALALAALSPHFDFPATDATVPAFFTSADVQRIRARSVVLIAPFARDTSTSEPMLWQAVAAMRFRMPAGYATGPDNSGRFSFLPIPTPLSELMQSVQRSEQTDPMTPEKRTELLGELRADHVETIIVGPFSQRDAMIELFRGLLGRPPEHIGGVDVWWQVS
jgi:hypothetical protein